MSLLILLQKAYKVSLQFNIILNKCLNGGTSVCKENIVKCIIFLASIFLKIYACNIYYYWDYGVLIERRHGSFPGICEC